MGKLAVGDIVVSVNGAAVEGLSHTEVKELMCEGTRLRLLIRRPVDLVDFPSFLFTKIVYMVVSPPLSFLPLDYSTHINCLNACTRAYI